MRQRRAVVSLDGLAITGGDDPEAVAIERELSERLRLAIARLPPREAAVFCLRYFDDLAYDRIAETLQITAGAVATALHKARGRLESFLLEEVKES